MKEPSIKSRLKCVGVIAIVCIAILSALIYCGLFGTYNEREISTKYEIYCVDAPFGKIWVETDGRFVFGCGYIDSELRESYTVKYFDGNKLCTMILDSTNSPIIDGHFYFEKVLHMVKVTSLYGITTDLKDTKYYPNPEYRIHLPALPKINQTESWSFVP